MLALGLGPDPGHDADRRRAHQRSGAHEHGGRRRRSRISFSSPSRSARWPECYVASDFSVLNVYENSNSAMPLIYKLTSVWGNHEGSMMLWVLILAVLRRAGRGVRHQSAGDCSRPMRSRCRPGSRRLLLFILLTRIRSCAFADAPFEGRDLNPILQDPASRSIRRCSISAMSASRSSSPSRSRR
jgi:hypothetical protein